MFKPFKYQLRKKRIGKTKNDNLTSKNMNEKKQ